ncbi:DUF6116 family protein [Denitromonas ohlonensis]|uniref:Uncharacterized protein n=2 Tax=Denitromonas TaxID=139331 RepID=A0A558CJ09_9RHOO|nr:DUF6116 family protein [Denitromonas ohlonensis]TVT48748.1 MAG: hypothetical protein FHP94_09635 [Denitromonas halophila]TVO63625.1 hypothetical protein FHP90_14200 [Denitromonas ohlonensis]TVO74159.1 hypothetical protein FHP89_16180 [Denitromonas ohlonensis]TVT74400.1 MAG: hypothetical protein FHP92_13505 [Denitromonas halophila]TVT75631.1 MAG: hypothetical protein FHP93_00005 [Denitromonas halophila]
MKTPFIDALLNRVARLRFPQIFLLTAAVFVVDLLVPDPLPFADEILFGLLTILFGLWRKGRGSDDRR